ncbi:L-fucose dehydrogenase-like [Epargyreus clarus]|uniref:L-fucose dehydrogenase-like n=1 Tax=Epargyreus clarus TaxID=520877 RepID=UPI003C2D7874
MSFKNKVVLVTGGSSGIGAAIAIAFAKEGANVAIVGRNESKLAAVAQKCGNALVINADVSNDDDVTRIVQTTVDTFGQIDVLVNNAGISRPGSITDGRLIQAYDEVIATNLRAPMKLTSLASPHLIKTKGNIINISAIGGQFAPSVPQLIPYCVSKAALNNFTLGSALEMSKHGVRVNAVSPGPVYTDILENSKYPNNWDVFKQHTALDRVSEPEEIADLVLFLASDKAKSITGANYVADNGMLLKR